MCRKKKIIATGQHISHSDETCPCFFLQGITYNQVVTVCPQLVGRVLYWQRTGGPVSFCCLAGEQVLDTRTFKVYSSFDDLAQAVAQGQGRVPMTSITLALAPNSPTLQAVFFNASQDKENFSFSKLFEEKNISSKDVGKPTAARRPPLSSLNASSAAKQQSTQPQESKTAVQPQNINPSDLCSQNTQSHDMCSTKPGQSSRQATNTSASSQGEVSSSEETNAASMERHTGVVPAPPRDPQAMPTPPVKRSIKYHASQPVDDIELAMYALLLTAYDGDRARAFQSHSLDDMITTSVVKGLQHLLGPASQLPPSAVRNYFLQARTSNRKRRRSTGRTKGQWRWDFFREETSNFQQQCAGSLRVLLDLASSPTSISCAIAHIRPVLVSAVEQAMKHLRGETDQISEFSVEKVRSSWQKRQHGFPLWHLLPPAENGSTALDFRKLSATPGGCECQLLVSNSMTWSASISGQPCDLSWAEVPESLACMEELDAVMATVQDTRECNGCSFEKYGDLAEKRDGVFLGKDKEVVATIDKTGQNPCIRAYRCSRLLPRGNSAMCSSCKSVDNTLRSAHSKFRGRNGEVAKNTTFSSMTREQLVNAAREGSKKIKKCQQEIKFL